MRRVVSLAFAIVAAAVLAAGAQNAIGVDPARLLKPGPDMWPMYNGDYSGRRFSTLKTINTDNVSSLSLAWVYRLAGGGIPGNVGTLKGTPVVVNGVAYATSPDHVWAIDARTGREIWHFGWQSKGGTHIGNRGVAILGESLFFETPDCHLVALNAKDGTEKWRKEICDLDLFYYGSVAPTNINNKVIAGVSGDDLDR